MARGPVPGQTEGIETLIDDLLKVGYRQGENGAELETMDYLEFIARVTLHIPDKGQVMVRYYGLYANAHRGKVRKVDISPLALRMSGEEFKPVPSKGWAAMIRKVKEIQSFRKWPGSKKMPD